jgi:hypothetical protein
MKPETRTTPSRPMKQAATPSIPLVIRRPFTNPIPVQDELMKRFGPKNPTPPGTQI